MTEHHIEIREATKLQAAEIASLIMMAMTDDCCLYFCVGLLVDKDNPDGEALYSSVGFRYVGDNRWGGHPMKHMIL